MSQNHHKKDKSGFSCFYTHKHMVQRALKHKPGILQSSKISSQVLDPRMPSLSSFCAVEKPGIPYKTQTPPLCLSIILCISFQQNERRIPRRDQNENTQSRVWIYLFNNESCDASLMGFRIRLCINNEDVGIWSVCDPELVAIQNIVVAWGRRQHNDKMKLNRKQNRCYPAWKTFVWVHW